MYRSYFSTRVATSTTVGVGTIILLSNPEGILFTNLSLINHITFIAYYYHFYSFGTRSCC